MNTIDLNAIDLIMQGMEGNYISTPVVDKVQSADTPSITPSTQQKKVFHSTIAKFEKSQKLKNELIPYLTEHYPSLLGKESRKQRIKGCCNSVSFRRYLDSGDVCLSNASFCKYDRICIACATKRAMRMIKKFSSGIQQYGLYNKHRYYIVLTIRHKAGDTLEEGMDRLMSYKEKLARAYRNSKRDNQKHKSFFSQFDGMVISIEMSHKGKNGRHPHINILACSDVDIQIDVDEYDWNRSKGVSSMTSENLKNEWKLHTRGTSYIHNIRKIVVDEHHYSRSGIGEVFKYAIKFSDLSVEQLAEVMNAQVKNRYRLFATYGIFRGWNIEQVDKEKGEWSEGVFLWDEASERYEMG